MLGERGAMLTIPVSDLEKARRFYEGTLGQRVASEEYDFPGLRTENGVAELEGERAAWFRDPDGNILTVFELTG